MTINERFAEILNIKNISIKEASEILGKSEGYVRKLLIPNQSFGLEPIKAILNSIGDINIEWLITGDGEMLKTKEKGLPNSLPKSLPIDQNEEITLSYNIPDNNRLNAISETEANRLNAPKETRPRIPVDAAAGALSIAINGITHADCEQIEVIKAFAKYDFTIFAKGDSMEPHICGGDELACSIIKDRYLIQWGRVYVLDTIDGIIVKRVYDNGDYFLCVSDNNDRYKDFNVRKSDVYNLALVVGMVRRY